MHIRLTDIAFPKCKKKIAEDDARDTREQGSRLGLKLSASQKYEKASTSNAPERFDEADLALLLTNLHKRYAYVCEPDASYAIFQNFF